ncbi:hypothetical protein Nepgr_002237 [Nepenthes gracilis]|uniref:Uncharacterized protein n=1 Tax=Nepenthes gracilis TaxID=150966 RepID=A0AAD3P8J3_NEPGR|nr:hypothetical protein Nepgr_002237 [Nepenthes gracilis]
MSPPQGSSSTHNLSFAAVALSHVLLRFLAPFEIRTPRRHWQASGRRVRLIHLTTRRCCLGASSRSFRLFPPLLSPSRQSELYFSWGPKR